jgi:isoaspartyl peptidase/L-asparaginase-like protein (Ntn-hydrolase superfamily)
MKNRRDFLKKAAFGSAAIGIGISAKSQNILNNYSGEGIVISTWNNMKANEAAWSKLSSGGSALDAVEAGVKVPEADPNDMSVGYGGRPDRDGKVTLDACIMDHEYHCGSVTFLEHIKHPISVARLVMEKTPHVMLSGEGALQFAMENGFKKENLLTKKAEKEWKEWVKESVYKPVINIENHDTIGMLALDKEGRVSGACTTSGAAYKMRGRVGDSPIIGSGLYVDAEIGGATATGLGEGVIRTVGSHLVVELMRQGAGPGEACKLAVERILRRIPEFDQYQVGFLALNTNGEFGGYSIQKGFIYAVLDSTTKEVIKANSAL